MHKPSVADLVESQERGDGDNLHPIDLHIVDKFEHELIHHPIRANRPTHKLQARRGWVGMDEVMRIK